ncbi:MAG: hypothetical protein Q8O32_03430 [bacterium]|nr:hypothetical protein [bacterium]
MSDFSKYLDNKEELISIFKSKSNKSRLYLNLLLLLIAFFVLYPIWRGAPDGFWLWLIMVVIIINNIIQVFLAQKDLYLLTDSRIIYLKAVNPKDFKNKKSLYLKNIKAIKKYHRSTIEFLIFDKKYYLSNIDNRDNFYHRLEIYLKNKNLV